jgi:2-dehydropantoate 2-reductase
LLARRYAGGQDGVEVAFIARGEHLEQIRRNGLQYNSPGGAFTAIPAAATDQPASLGLLDVVLFCVKTYSLQETSSLLAPNVGAQTTVISVMNGVDNAERLQAAYPRATVLNGGIYISAELVQPGMVRHIGGAGRTFFGAETGPHEPHLGIESVLKSAGISAEYRRDILWAVWEKYLFICPLASATTFTGKTFGELRADQNAWQLLDGLLGELEAVARAQGVSLPEGIHQATLDKVNNFPPGTKTSLQSDYERGKALELETFTGYVLRASQRLRIPAPLHEMVYARLKSAY